MTRPNTGKRSLTEQEMLAYLQTHVRQAGDCLVWAGTYYGHCPVVRWRKKRYQARRLLIELQGRPIGRRQVVYVTCDEPLCMSHLAVGSKKQERMRYSKLGRLPTRARASVSAMKGHAPRAKLGLRNAAAVLRMRSEGMSLAKIGAHFGVTAQAVHGAIGRWSRAGIGFSTGGMDGQANEAAHRRGGHHRAAEPGRDRGGDGSRRAEFG